MSAEVPLEPLSEELLRHAAAVRSLSRRLLADEHAAEDVVQETWLTALEQPPKSFARIGGWLRTVARTRALRYLRGSARREQRERGAARDERLDSTADVLEQRELLRSVVGAVLALDEPYQTAILLRYYRGLAPRAIATRLGVPVATVQSRLHRALARLRAELDREHGARGGREHWAPALATLLGLEQLPVLPSSPTAESAATRPLGIPSMLFPVKLLAGAALAGLVSVPFLLSESRREPGLRAAGASAGASSAEQDAAPLVDEAPALPAAGRTPLDGAGATLGLVLPAPETPAEPSFEFVVTGTVVADDRPAAGATVRLGPLLHPLNDASTTGSDGAFSVRWRGRAARMSVAIAAQVGLQRSELRLLELVAGVEARVQLELPSLADLHLERKVALAASHDGSSTSVEAERRIVEMHQQMKQHTLTRQAPAGLRLDPDGYGTFRGDLVAATVSHGIVERDTAHALVERRALAGAEQHERELAKRLHPRSPARPSRGAAFAGVVVDERARPAAGARITVTGATTTITTEADASGRFSLTVPAGVELAAVAGGGDHGLARMLLRAPPAGAELRWDPVLDRGAEVRGVLRGPDGAPLAGAWITFALDGAEARSNATRTDGAGRFVLLNLPDATGTLYVRTEQDALPVRVVEGVSPGAPPLELVLSEPDLALGAVALVVHDVAGAPQKGAVVRLWQVATGRGTWATNAGSGGYRAAGLPAGSYRVEAGVPGFGWVDVGALWLAPGEELDLGTVVLPAPGRLVTVAAPGTELPAGLCFELFLVRDDVLSLLAEGGLDAPWAGELPPGSYALRVAGADRGPRLFDAQVESRASTELVLDLAR